MPFLIKLKLWMLSFLFFLSEFGCNAPRQQKSMPVFASSSPSFLFSQYCTFSFFCKSKFFSYKTFGLAWLGLDCICGMPCVQRKVSDSRSNRTIECRLYKIKGIIFPQRNVYLLLLKSWNKLGFVVLILNFYYIPSSKLSFALI